MKHERNKFVQNSIKYIQDKERQDIIDKENKLLRDTELISLLKNNLEADFRWQEIINTARNEDFLHNLEAIQTFWDSLLTDSTKKVSIKPTLSHIADFDELFVEPESTIEDMLNRGVKIHITSDSKTESMHPWFFIHIKYNSYGFGIIVNGPHGQPKIFKTITQLNYEITEGIKLNNPYILKFSQKNVNTPPNFI